MKTTKAKSYLVGTVKPFMKPDLLLGSRMELGNKPN